MPVAIPAKAIERISTAPDQKQAILEMIGNLDDIEVIGDNVLIGIYIRPEKSKGGIILTGRTLEEDIWQGKAGLVLKWGPEAFRNPENGELYEQHVNVGEWGVFKVGDAWSLNIRDVPCRLVKDVNLRLKVKDPSVVF